jgi:peptide deformylase
MPHSDTSGGMDEELLPILIAPHKTLKTKAREVKTADMDHVRDLVPRMFASMYKAPGIGLAAPQVDVGLRFFIVDLMPNEKSSPIVLVNPEIVRVSEDTAQPVCRCQPPRHGSRQLLRPGRQA